MPFLILLFFKDGMTWEERAQVLNQYLIIGIILILLISFWLIRNQRKKERRNLDRERKRKRQVKTKKAVKYSCLKLESTDALQNTVLPVVFQSPNHKTTDATIVLYKDEIEIGVITYSLHKNSGVLLNCIQLEAEQKVEVFMKQVGNILIAEQKTYIATYTNKGASKDNLLLTALGFDKITIGKKEQQEMPGLDFWKLRL